VAQFRKTLPIPGALHDLDTGTPPVDLSAAALNNFLGIKGAEGLRFSPTLVPILETLRFLTLTNAEIVTITRNHAAGDNATGNAIALFTVPVTEAWLIFSGALNTDVLDADQAIAAGGLTPYYADRVVPVGLAGGLLRVSGSLSAGATGISTTGLAVNPLEIIRPGSTVGYIVQSPATLGAAGVISISARALIVRIKV
jgi:hypothetical protein